MGVRDMKVGQAGSLRGGWLPPLSPDKSVGDALG
jgi:hypothetical protein